MKHFEKFLIILILALVQLKAKKKLTKLDKRGSTKHIMATKLIDVNDQGMSN